MNSQVEERSGAPHVPSEIARKLVHIAFGFVAFSLRWLSWYQALALAACAFFFNWLILPRVGGKHISRDRRGYDLGIMLYPVMVFLLILVFREKEHIAGAAWAILAFGDGAATLFGRTLKGPKLPWNAEKSFVGSVAFLVVGIPAAYAVTLVLKPSPPSFAVIAFAVLIAAVVESLATGIDDNITVALFGAAALWWLEGWTRAPQIDWDGTTVVWLLINLALAIAGYAGKSVNVSGFVAGALLGSVLIVFAGWPLYVVLLAFFVLGTGATKLGYRQKHADGLAQEGDGRRGASHAFANVGVAAVLAISMAVTDWPVTWLWIGAIAALATAAADTCSSEIGQLIGKRTFLPLSFRSVTRGTEGAISVEGTVAGLLAGAIVAVVGVAAMAWSAYRILGDPFAEGAAVLWEGFPVKVLIITAAAFIGGYLESVAGSFNRRARRPVSNGTLNFFNTAVGAALAMVGAMLAGLP